MLPAWSGSTRDKFLQVFLVEPVVLLLWDFQTGYRYGGCVNATFALVRRHALIAMATGFTIQEVLQG